MKKIALARKIVSIQTRSLFTGRYAQGIRQLRNLEKHADSKNRFLCSYGVLYDHLAMNAKGQRRLRLENIARSYYRDAMKRGVGGLNPYWGLGRILIHKKRYAAALRYYRKAYDMKPASRWARLAYATALYWSGRASEAKKLFLADRRKYGPSFRSSFNLVGIEEKLGNHAKRRAYAAESLRFFRRNKYRRTTFGKAWEAYLQKRAESDARMRG